MAADFDIFPVYDAITKPGSNKISDIWVSFFATFYENLVGYMGSFGTFIPNITTAQRDSIQSPQAGQMIYNTTTNAPQIFQGGVWKTFTTT